MPSVGHTSPTFDEYLATKVLPRLISDRFRTYSADKMISDADIEEIVAAYTEGSGFERPSAYLLSSDKFVKLVALGICREHVSILLISCCYAYFNSRRGKLTAEDVVGNIAKATEHLERAGFEKAFIRAVSKNITALHDETQSQHSELQKLFIDFNIMLEISEPEYGVSEMSRSKTPDKKIKLYHLPLWKVPREITIENLTPRDIWDQYGRPWTQALLDKEEIYCTQMFSRLEARTRAYLQELIGYRDTYPIL